MISNLLILTIVAHADVDTYFSLRRTCRYWRYLRIASCALSAIIVRDRERAVVRAIECAIYARDIAQLMDIEEVCARIGIIVNFRAETRLMYAAILVQDMEMICYVRQKIGTYVLAPNMRKLCCLDIAQIIRDVMSRWFDRDEFVKVISAARILFARENIDWMPIIGEFY